MRKRISLIAVLLFAAPVLAGERFLGAIVSAAGADTTNGSTATPFAIGPLSKLTLWCNAVGFVITDTFTAASATNAMPLSANEKFPTAVGDTKLITVNSSRSAVVRIFGAGAITCYVFERTGKE